MSEELKNLNPEELENVAGGMIGQGANGGNGWSVKEDSGSGTLIACPKCGSTNLSITKVYSKNHGDFTCKDCGNFFTIQL